MPQKVTRFSAKKNLGNRSKKRKPINFAKNNQYSLDSRIIRRRVEKDMRLFAKHRKRMLPKPVMRLQEKIIRELCGFYRRLLGIGAAIAGLNRLEDVFRYAVNNAR